jgi:hypothetical protein
MGSMGLPRTGPMMYTTGDRGATDDRGPMHGKDAVRAYLQDWIDMFDNFKVEPVELIDAGEDNVVAVIRFGGRAKLSGIETDQTAAIVYMIRDGRSQGAGAPPTVKRQVFEAFALEIRFDKVGRRIEISATVSEVVAKAFENAKDLQKEVPCVYLPHRGDTA